MQAKAQDALSCCFDSILTILTHRLLNSEFILESAQGRCRRRGLTRRGKGSGAGNESGDGKRFDHGWHSKLYCKMITFERVASNAVSIGVMSTRAKIFGATSRLSDFFPLSAA